MSAYGIAWLVILLCAGIGGGVIYRLLRSLDNLLFRKLIAGVLVTFFVVPAPVPEYWGQWAPAFVVFIFEAFFQTDGAPLASVRILLIALVFVALVIGVTDHFSMRGPESDERD